MDSAEKIYPRGNAELLSMFKTKPFDREVAQRLLKEISDLNQPISDLHGYTSTYLFEAQSENNVEAVQFLLENGADPNFRDENLISECALDDLHFLWEEMEEESAQRLKIAKLFFDFGGDPNLQLEGETLYDHVLWEVFNDDISPHQCTYIIEFFKILIAYGGGGGNSYYHKPSLAEPIDKNRIEEYKLELFLCEDGYHLEGHLFNPDGIDIGIV